MRSYATADPDSNLLAPLTFDAPRWSLKRALTFTREQNPRHRTGRGAKRRSKYEHQLDEGLALLGALGVEGEVVQLGGRRHIVRQRATLYPFELLTAPLGANSGAVVAYRAKVARLARWLHENGPRAGWALRQSQRRAARDERATAWYLPRRSWTAFLRWRRVLRRLAGLLVTLAAWWGVLIPAPRGVASEATAEEARPPALTREREAGTRCRDQSPVELGELLRRVGRFFDPPPVDAVPEAAR